VQQTMDSKQIPTLIKVLVHARGLHRKAALTTIYQPFNFRTVDDRKDWLK
jgi:hypothetical protein